jgi:CBS domain-containing protein
MNAKDIMVETVVTVTTGMEIEELCDLMQMHKIKGAPVVDDRGHLIGIVTQDDVIYGRLGLREDVKEGRDITELFKTGFAPVSESEGKGPRFVGEIMTSPAISADEGTDVEELCRTMWTLRIHRIPIVREGRVTGIVSSMDLCKAIASGLIRLD